LEDEKNFNTMLCTLQGELESGKKVLEHEKQYAKYFQQLVPEKLFQCMGIVIRSDLEVPLIVKARKLKTACVLTLTLPVSYKVLYDI